MCIMRLLSIEKTKKKCFVLVRDVELEFFEIIVRISYHIDVNVMNLKRKFQRASVERIAMSCGIQTDIFVYMKKKIEEKRNNLK